MRVVVQKFGGSLLESPGGRLQVAELITATRRRGRAIVAVVSAIGREGNPYATDTLMGLMREIGSDIDPRTLDLLLSTGEIISTAVLAHTLVRAGCPPIALTGAQAGILTSDEFNDARILRIDPTRARAHLERDRVVVVAGFQGVTPDGQITTLGRGGSDTTAVALAAALTADACEIYTDVDGIYTADPRLVPDARKIEKISYEAILELASLGAKVMASRSILFGMKYNVPIHVRHSMLPDPGTWIVAETEDMEQEEVTGVALKTNLGRVTLTGLPGGPGVQARIFAAVGAAGIMVDDIIQSEVARDHTNVSFTVDHADLVDIRPVLDRIVRELGRGEVRVDVGLCKVSAVGVGMRSHTGVAARWF